MHNGQAKQDSKDQTPATMDSTYGRDLGRAEQELNPITIREKHKSTANSGMSGEDWEEQERKPCDRFEGPEPLTTTQMRIVYVELNKPGTSGARQAVGRKTTARPTTA